MKINVLQAIGMLPAREAINTMRCPDVRVVKEGWPKDKVIAALKAAPRIDLGAYPAAGMMGYDLSITDAEGILFIETTGAT